MHLADTFIQSIQGSGVARILFLGGPGQKWAGTRLTNWSSPVRKSAAPNRELNGGLRGWLYVTIF